MKNFKISTKIYLGFGCVLILAMIAASVGYIGLQNAESTFATYRKLARQTNADGRVQANMLMTRIFAKNFVIDANRENIIGVQERAKRTLLLIRETLDLAGVDTGRQVLLEDLEESLQRYVAKFEEVTALQAQRDNLVNNQLNVIGPATERALTQIMNSAVDDGNAVAGYQAGITLRSLMLGRLYANRFLIENDNASRARAIQEFRDVEFNYLKLTSELENPERRELANLVLENQRKYLQAFDQVQQTITQRNNLIQYELDRIGPAVANRIERLKLAIKHEQDSLGPKAEAAITRSVVISLTVSALVLLLGAVAAILIGMEITRPIRQLSNAAVAMGEGDLAQDMDIDRADEIGLLANSLTAMRDSIIDKVTTLEQENAERRRAEKELAETHGNLENIVAERTEELAAARDDAEQATKAKAEFLAAMSHEIRTPMNGVIGMIDLLQQTKVSRDQKEMIDTVRSSAYSLLTIINDILDFSKIDAGKLELESAPMSVCDVVEGVTETLAATSREKGILIRSFVDPAIPDALLGDSVRLRQILFNLCGNAVKFTEQGSVTIRADKLPSSSSGNIKVQFQVIDTGIGISDDAQATLFEAFTQAEGSTTRRFGGTGLGLTISQRLVQIMDGRIEVESELGKGSCFSATLTFPVATEHQIKSDGYELQDLNVLLAVQDTFLRESLLKYLRHWGANVTIQPEFELVESQVVTAAETTTPFDVLFMENIGFRARTDTIRAIQEAVEKTSTTFVLQVDHRQAEREDLENTVYAVLNPIKRAAFVRAIAAAAGRTSPDVEYDEIEEMPVTAVEPPSVAEAEASGQLILLAEDNITNQKVIIRQLNSLGYTAVLAEDGALALEALKTRKFAILLTDCHMPNLDGFDLTRKIREQEQDEGGPRMPIVAITASALTEEVSQCYECGMDDFLSKPVETAKLHMALKKWMPDALGGPNVVAFEPPVKDGDDEKRPIDITFLEQTFDGQQDAIVEILKDFVNPSVQCREEVESALSENSLEGVAQGSHKLKSAARSIGAHDLADVCEEIETASRKGDWGPVKTLTPQLNSRVDEVVDYIQQL